MLPFPPLLFGAETIDLAVNAVGGELAVVA